MWRKLIRIVFAGIAGGFLGNGLMGAIFSFPFIKSVLYNPSLQSQLFIDITPKRNIPISVIGLIMLSILNAYFFWQFQPSIPGKQWLQKGLYWGLTISGMYWLFQEWFIYHTLLGEPLVLNMLELIVLTLGSLLEGIIISYVILRFNHVNTDNPIVSKKQQQNNGFC